MSAIGSPLLVEAIERSELLGGALERARKDHAGQIRNGSGGLPYIEHPQAVAALLAEHGYGEEVLAAALLHDVVEDSETTVEELREAFGDQVAGLVAALSDDESIPEWHARKDEHRRRVAAAGGGAMAIFGADKLTNVSTLRRAMAAEGEAAGEEFDVPLEDKIAVWNADLEMLRERAPEIAFLDTLGAELNLLQATREAADPRPGT
jgi:(p)ppGpp synthase/HD superfamily hydrolase